jgi:hypothetical protein
MSLELIIITGVFMVGVMLLLLRRTRVHAKEIAEIERMLDRLEAKHRNRK